MNNLIRYYFLFIVMLLLSHNTYSQSNEDLKIINQFIITQCSDSDGGYEYEEGRKIISGDLNNDSISDMAVCYSIVGAGGGNSGYQMIAIFLRVDKKLKLLGNYFPEIEGFIELDSIKNNQLIVKTFEYKENDARCCPSKEGLVKYELGLKKL